MAMIWTDSTDGIDWDELAALYHAAPLGNKNAADLKIAFSNSRFTLFARDHGALVAVGRALADGVDCAYLCDVAVLPSHQGLGLGKAIVNRLLELLRDHKKIILYSVPGKETFYRKFGFSRMTTAMAIFEDQPLAYQRGYVTDN